nr:hypothetical protein CFP56_79414 [Quercus suber]
MPVICHSMNNRRGSRAEGELGSARGGLLAWPSSLVNHRPRQRGLVRRWHDGWGTAAEGKQASRDSKLTGQKSSDPLWIVESEPTTAHNLR